MRVFFGALLAVLFLAQASCPARAQDMNLPTYPVKKSGKEKETSRFRPGAQIGLDISNYTNNPNVNSSARVGYIAGLELEYRLTPEWFLQQEVRAVQKGFAYNLNPGYNAINFDSRIVYIEIPLLVKRKFIPHSLIQPYVLFGPDLGFKVSNNVDVTQGGNYVTGPALNVLFNTIDFSVIGGFGGEYHFAERMAGFLEFRASIGLVNVSGLAGTNWKSRDYQFVFGGLFDLF